MLLRCLYFSATQVRVMVGSVRAVVVDTAFVTSLSPILLDFDGTIINGV